MIKKLIILLVVMAILLVGCGSVGSTSKTHQETTQVNDKTQSFEDAGSETTATSKDAETKSSANSKNTSKNTQSTIRNNPKFIKCEVVKNPVKKSYFGFGNKPKIERLKIVSKPSLAFTADTKFKSYLEKKQEFSLKICIANPERDTILDVLLNDSQEGENCLYSSGSTIFKLSSIDTLWDKAAKTYYTYVTLSLPTCKKAGARMIQILEINFLRNVINKQINGNVDLNANKSNTKFDVMCIKENYSITFENVKTTSASASFSLNIKDVDKSISKIVVSLYNQNNLKEKKSNITDHSSIEFNSLEPNTDYTVRVDCTFNRNDQAGVQAREHLQNVLTYLKGSGTESDPYQITKISDWAIMVKDSQKNKHYKLMNDIDCNYKDIKSGYFYGIFDGNNHTVFNLSITSPYDSAFNTRQSYALFYGNYGIIKNLSVKNVDIDVVSECWPPAGGGIVAFNGETGTIQNCFASGKIHIELSEKILNNVQDRDRYYKNIYLGGISGSNRGKIIGCTDEVQIIK